ncbi:MAG: hypothetical protein Q7R87_05050 [Nanoarchaeota archaeon]|nr:hypothetical protein [Nanoarchaeota archaeon]
MAWKDWSYWLRGGIILSIIFAVFLLLALYLDSTYGGHPGLSFLLLMPVALLIKVNGLNTMSFMMVAIPLSLIFWFAMGTLIGWIYGKLKNRNVTK